MFRCGIASIRRSLVPSQPASSTSMSTQPPKKKFMRKIQLDFYYDTISPYSWLAFEILQRYKPVWNLHIDFKPVLMGAISKNSGNKFLDTLMPCPNKAKYMFHDLERTGKYFQVPLRAPESPFYLFGVAGSLKQQRFLTAVKQHYPDLLEPASREFWFRCWSEDMDATKESSLIVVGNRAGLSNDQIAHVLDEMEKDETKEALKKSTEEALNEGAFGLPFLAVHHSRDNVETFFGSDRFEVFADRMRLKWLGPVPDPEQFVPLEMPPDATQQELFEELEKAGAISVQIPDEAKSVFKTTDDSSRS